MAPNNNNSAGAPSPGANKQQEQASSLFDLLPFGPKDLQDADEGPSHEDGRARENQTPGSEGNEQPNSTSEGTHYGLESFMQQAANQFTLTYTSNMSNAASALHRHHDLLQQAADVEAQAEQTITNLTTMITTMTTTIRNQAATRAAAIRRHAQNQKETVENLTRTAVLQWAAYEKDTISAAKGLVRDGIPVNQLITPSMVHPNVLRRLGSMPADISRKKWASLNSWSGLSKDKAADLVAQLPSKVVPGDVPASSEDMEALALAVVQGTADSFLTPRPSTVPAPPTTQDTSNKKRKSSGNSTSVTTKPATNKPSKKIRGVY